MGTPGPTIVFSSRLPLALVYFVCCHCVSVLRTVVLKRASSTTRVVVLVCGLPPRVCRSALPSSYSMIWHGSIIDCSTDGMDGGWSLLLLLLLPLSSPACPTRTREEEKRRVVAN